ncbi:MAG: type II toxin-antitoxin system Phd/YefM family antitoxin [Chloroflexota bacterium]|nr:MAG: type II toxin-antitoxin system Phd/YefM family antitoxin [Chloroflexota bacterium]
MSKSVSVAEAKNNFSDLLNRVIYRRERIIVSKHGKPVGALISTKDLEQLEELEKQQAIARIKEIKKRTKKYYTLEEVRREYEKKWGVNLDDIEAETD